MLNQRSARRTGFTLVEVMMASLILVVGFIGLIQAVAISSNMMDTARRQTLAAQIINHEIEKLRFKTWAEIQSLTGTNLTLINHDNNPDSPFLTAIAFSGATYSLSSSVSYIDPTGPEANSTTTTVTDLREVTFTVTWEVTTSRRKDDGALVTFKYTRVNSAYFGKYGLNLTYQRS